MHRLKRLLITLPVLALPLLVAAAAPATAALSAEQGLLILAKAKAADGKCHFLSAGERRELSSYLARADSKRDAQRTPQSRDALFAEFLQWREQQEARAARNESTKEVAPQQPVRSKRKK